MARNGVGVWVRLYNWVNDAAASILIRADRMDAEMNDMANGLTNSISKDGQTVITGNLPMAGFKHTGVANGIVATDYAAFGQIQPVDATLTALAGLATGVDQLPYSTGTDTFSQTPLTAFVRTFLDDADAATVRTTLGSAALAGLSTQVFAVANAAASTQAVALGQADARYILSGADASGINKVIIAGSTVLTSAAHSGKILDPWGATAGSNITLPLTASNVFPTGFNVLIGPNSFGVNLVLPAAALNNVYGADSGVVVAPGGTLALTAGPGRAWRIYEFANSCRLEVIGNAVVANSVNNNEAVNRAQSSVGAVVQDLTASRAVATTYTNSTARMKFVHVALAQSAAGVAVTVTGTVNGIAGYIGTTSSASAAGYIAAVGFPVPPGGTYSVNYTGVASTISKWMETT